MSIVLAVGAHPDDVELGCGGTLAKHVLSGDEVHVVFIADGETSRPGAGPEQIERRKEQSVKACEALGIPKENIRYLDYPDQRLDGYTLLNIAQDLQSATSEIKPEIVYTHSECDLNKDHRITCQAVKTVFRPQESCNAREILSFEVPSSTEWNFGEALFAPNEFVDVTGIPIERKFMALCAYKSEMRAWPHPRSALAVQSLASLRGAQVGLQAAEAFGLLWRRR